MYDVDVDENQDGDDDKEADNTKAVELKGEFLRIKHENFDLRNELNVANMHNDQHFEQLQHAVSRSEHDNVVSEYKMQLDALAREHSLQLTDKFGDDGPKLDELMKTMTPRPKWRRTGASKQILVDCGVFARTDSSSTAVEKLIQGFMDVSEKLTSANVELARLKEAQLPHAASSQHPGASLVFQVSTFCIPLIHSKTVAHHEAVRQLFEVVAVFRDLRPVQIAPLVPPALFADFVEGPGLRVGAARDQAPLTVA